MNSCNTAINRLLNFGLQKGLITEQDKIYTANMLIGTLGLNEFVDEPVEEQLSTAAAPLQTLLDYAVAEGMIEDTVTERDLLDTKLMNCLMPRPSEVIGEFNALYAEDPQKATDYFYALSIASNYIRKDRTDKNIIWKASTAYGDLDITINLSKPEKDPKDIAKAKAAPQTGYPKCLLCKENEGFFGSMSHPARENHRIIPMSFSGEDWFLQYSPYTYYNEHCIVLNKKHTPMSIRRKTFDNLLGFVELLPHYFVGSNADLPIVGGSILAHDHYQGGHYTFAMEKAAVEKAYSIPGYEDIQVGRVCWPMSVLRLRSGDKARLIDLADHILQSWRGYSDQAVGVLAESDGEPHNTITPIARKKDGQFELDLVLRNNRTSKEYPLGIFHPHAEVHHIKKENIGLIEVMGLAVLPARLKNELAEVEQALVAGKKKIDGVHADWYKQIAANQGSLSPEQAKTLVQAEVGKVFATVLEHAGVFKRNEAGIAAFDRFVSQL